MINPIICGGGWRKLLDRVSTLETNRTIDRDIIHDLCKHFYDIVRLDYAGNFQKAVQDEWLNIPDGIISGLIFVGSVYGYICQKIESGRYGSLIIFSYGGNHYLITKAGDTWTCKDI